MNYKEIQGKFIIISERPSGKILDELHQKTILIEGNKIKNSDKEYAFEINEKELTIVGEEGYTARLYLNGANGSSKPINWNFLKFSENEHGTPIVVFSKVING